MTRPSSLSFEKRLPLLICLLLLCIVTSYGIISYIGIRKASIQAGKERQRSLRDQLSNMFGQSAQALVGATRTAADQDAFRQFLHGSTADSLAQRLLTGLRKDSTWVEAALLDAGKNTVLSSALPGINMPVERITDTAVIGELFQYHNSVYYSVSAPVRENSKVIGYLVRWRLQKTSPASIEQFTRLLGNNATFYVGNRTGGFWTDLIKKIPAPAPNLQADGKFVEYTNQQSGTVLASVAPIPHTPWLVLVEIPKQSIMQGANRFLAWILLTGLLLTGIGILIVWIMSRNITLPLKTLTAATTAVASGDYSVTVPAERGDEVGELGRSFNEMIARVAEAKQDLENKVGERTAELEHANKELEAFSYSVSHDLRAPLRAINGFATVLKEEYSSQLDEEANRLTDRICANAKMMGQLIDDLISFSQLARKEVHHQVIDMMGLADICLAELLQQEPAGKFKVNVHSLAPCYGDKDLVKQVWLNIIGNALKYSAKSTAPVIEIGCEEGSSMNTYYVKDNGVGFDMQHADKLFGVFQRLHSRKEFEGTGVGLALAKRIIDQHKGLIRGESVPGEGATFYFTLPAVQVDDIKPTT